MFSSEERSAPKPPVGYNQILGTPGVEDFRNNQLIFMDYAGSPTAMPIDLQTSPLTAVSGWFGGQ